MNKQITKKVVATFTSVATVAMLTAGAFMPLAAGAAITSEPPFLMRFPAQSVGELSIDSQGNIFAISGGLLTKFSPTGSVLATGAGQFGPQLDVDGNDCFWGAIYGSYSNIGGVNNSMTGSCATGPTSLSLQAVTSGGSPMTVFVWNFAIDPVTNRVYFAYYGNEAPTAPPALYMRVYDLATGLPLQSTPYYAFGMSPPSSGIKIDARNNIILLYAGGLTRSFAPSGNSVSVVGGGTGTNQAGDIAVDAAGRPWILRSTDKVVQAMQNATSGFGSGAFAIAESAHPGLFSAPAGLALTASGDNLYVSDPGTNEIIVFGAPLGPTPTPIPGEKVCSTEDFPGKICICHYPDGNPENVQVIQVNSNAVKGHIMHGDDTFNETTQTCDVPVTVSASDSGSSSGSLLALAAAALAAGLGVGLYARRRA